MQQSLQSLQQKVTLLRAEGKYKETIKASYELLRLGSEENDAKSILTAHINNAAAYYCIGDIEEALKSIDCYTELCKQHGDENDWINLYNVSFLLYEMNKDYVKAKETLYKSIELAKKNEKYNIVSNGYSNLSYIYMVEENFELALKMAQKGLEMARLHKPESPILEFRVKLNIAKSYIYLNQMSKAKQLIDVLINEPFLSSFMREHAQCYDLQGFWFMKNKQYKEAFDSYTKAKSIVESYNDVNFLKSIQEFRCQLCELMNDVEMGFKVQKEYITLLKQISERELELTALKLDVKHSLSEMMEKATLDHLTGVYNRNLLEERANEWLTQAALHQQSIVCMVFDLDNLKSLNDQHGHLVGDEAIKHVSKIFAEALNESEIIGRYGGDEFVIIMKDATLQDSEKKAIQMKDNLKSNSLLIDGQNITLQISMGLADNARGEITTFEQLFYKADVALYKAKKAGKNQIYINNTGTAVLSK